MRGRTRRSRRSSPRSWRPCEGARALTFSSGYLANLAILTALARRSDAIFADRLQSCVPHRRRTAVARDAAPLSARRSGRACAARLAAIGARRRFIVTDAVFSMDGDIAPLPELLALADAHDAWLVVDDAHGFGVLGGGPRRARAIRPRVRADRLHGHARQGGGRRGRVRRRASIRHRNAACRRRGLTSTRPPRRRCWRKRCARRCDIVRSDAPRRAHLRIADRVSFAPERSALPWPLLPSSTPIQPLIVGDPRAAVAVCGCAARSAAFWCRRSGRRRCRRERRGCAYRCRRRTAKPTSRQLIAALHDVAAREQRR